MHFNLTDLRLFVQLAEAGSMTAASKRAHLSVASISTRIKALEENMLARLIWRSSRGTELTPAGERLLKHARLILAQVDALKLEFQEGDCADIGHVRLVANTTTVKEILPEILASFLAEHPSVSIDLQERPHRDIARAVMDGSADIGIVTGPFKGADVDILHFSTDKLVTITPKGHPLSNHRAVTLAQVVEHPLIVMYEGSTLTNFLQEKMEEYGQELHTRVQLYSYESICRMVEVGVGVGIVPNSAVQRHSNTMQFDIVPLAEPWVTRERSVLVRNLELLPACAKALITAITESQSTEE